MSVTRPLRLSNWIQSPTRTELSSWIASPPSTLPSVSCMAKARTAVMIAEVAMMPVRSTPSTRICDRP